MPGKPQIWYLDLFAGKNDTDAVKCGGVGGHKEINRTNLTNAQAEAALPRPIVRDQLALLRLRNACPAFGFDARLTIEQLAPHLLTLRWTRQNSEAALYADLRAASFRIEAAIDGKPRVFER